MYLRLPTSSSIGHSVNMQNSGATRQISPVRRHTTVGVPLYEMSFSSSCLGRQLADERKKKKAYEQGALETPLDKHFVFVCHGHLERNQRRPKYSEGANDAKDIIFFESVTQDIPTRGRHQEWTWIGHACVTGRKDVRTGSEDVS